MGVSSLNNPMREVSSLNQGLGRVPGVQSTYSQGERDMNDLNGGMFNGISDDEVNRRVMEARRNLGAGTLSSLFTTMLQSSGVKTPPRDDTYIDKMIRKTPQYVVDSQNAEVDRTTGAAINNVLSNNPLNRSTNAVNAIVAQGVQGKNQVAERRGQTDIGLENQYLGAKQNSLDRFNANTAQAENQMIDSENTRLGNIGGLATNYFNQVQDSVNNMNYLKDQNEVMKSNNYMQTLQYRNLLRMLEQRRNNNG